MAIAVTSSVLERLRSEAAKAHPEECCGLLLGQDGAIDDVRPARNVATDRARRFEIDPRVLIEAWKAERAGGAQVIGYYHSHPDGPAAPSATDRAQAPGDGRLWAIVGRAGDQEAQIAFWRDLPGRFAPLPYCVLYR